ncbi:hypothetical protein [Seonamhaeicola aphaedonensis]|uniref:Glycerophosphoryl diester phosphodiesterase family protein n=1 Tax=Seonamhaeicola aphaedonensis TaxID=1461338 RepID=A0A3D9HLI1_9FLAO|nr:hypothetical protein [Seonamhaeicola aphaedonensis]RED50350.1 hypothetical protein DFQ02_101379 [Seonamhaeicola aphaedonensis]
MNTVNTLIEKINSAKSLDFGNIFSDSIELFKKTWLQGFLLQLFTLIVMLPLIIVLYVPLIAAVIAQQESGYANESFESFIAGISVLYIVFILAGVLVLGAISVGLNAGFYRIMRKLDNNEVTTASDFFYFIKGKYLSKIFVLMLASFGVAILAALLCYLPIFYVMVPLSLFAIVFAFNPELSVGEIVKVSFKLGNKKWLLIFGLLLLSGLLAEIVGLMLCGIGLLFTAAFPYHPIYLIYKEVIGFDEVASIEEIGTHTE